jgi:DDE superfamily endonuclease
MYNWDEKGFLIGLAQSLKRIMTKKVYDSGRVTANAQDGSREFISLLASICADGTALPPALIYKGASRDLQDTWLKDLNEKQHAYFASSTNGWSSNAFGIAYLVDVFNPATRAKAGRGRRLLIVDGHSSHVNMEFITTCDRLKILLLILPPHSTHRLQPLDVGCFLPLSTCYTTKLNKVMEKSGGLVSFTKRMFWTTFKATWDNSMTSENILSAFEKCGIWPTKPDVILDVINPPRPSTPSDSSSDEPSTPYTVKRMRQFSKIHTGRPTKEAFRKLTKANEVNATRASIAKHRVNGLREALLMEQKKRRRGKKLNLIGEPSGKAQFFGTEEVLAAQAREAQKLALVEQEKLDKEKAKEEKAIVKAIKEALIMEEKR